jgi:hypothetical protein
MVRRIAALLVLLSGLLPAALYSAPGADPLSPPWLESSNLPAGPQAAETLLRVNGLGRYALQARSPRANARLELVDRMAGVLGGAQGRLDLFLEPGEYKLRVRKETGDPVELAVRAFDPANRDPEGRYGELGEAESLQTTLRDFQTLSWWVQVDESRPDLHLLLEGRSLQEAVLWAEGAWETGQRPLRRVRESLPGRPVTSLEFSLRLAPGRYLLTAVGGPRLAWARDTEEEPLVVRRGARSLGEMGLLDLVFDQTGEEHFLAAGTTSFYQLAAANNRGYRLAAAVQRPGGSRFDSDAQAQIDAKSDSYRCALNTGAASALHWLVVAGPPGERVQLRWLPARTEQRDPLLHQQYAPQKAHLTTLLAAAEGEESVDLTAVQVDIRRQGGQRLAELRELRGPSVGPGQPLRRRINSLGPDAFLLRVLRAGTYSLQENAREAGTARYSFWLLEDQLQGNDSPVQAAGGERVELKEKLYLVGVEPVKGGILDFAIMAERTGAGALFSSPAPRPANGLCWLTAKTEQESFLLLNNRFQVPSGVSRRYPVPVGVSLRELPADPANPLCVMVPPQGRLELPVRLASEARIASSDAGFAAARVDGQPWRPETAYPAGDHLLALSNPGATEAWHLLSLLPPERTAAAAPLPDPRAGLPRLAEGQPAWRTFRRGEKASFLLSVREPASYRLSTSGRLAMRLTVRTALQPRLAAAASRSDEPNAVLTAYLRPGDYLLEAETVGASAGRAGLLLERVELVAGSLAEGAVLRRTVPAGALLAADLRVEQQGHYQLECLALGRSFAYRLEDEGGWPVGPAAAPGVFSGILPPGRYRYVSAAETVPTRRLLALRRVPAPEPYDPKARSVSLALNRTYGKTWLEAPGRPEDVFTLECAAPLRATLHLSEGMLFRLGPAGQTPVYQGGGGQPREVELQAGRHELRVRSAAEDNLKEYRLALATADLAEGIPQAAPLPFGIVPFSVGRQGTVEIWSYGPAEADGALYDAEGRLVARAEPIADDWKFRIVAALAPGRYQLVVSSPGRPPELPPPVHTEETPAGAADEGYSEEEIYEEEYSEEEYVEEEVYDEEYSEEEYTDEEYDEEYGEEYPEPESYEASVPVPQLGPPPAGATLLQVLARQERQLPPASGELDRAVELADEVAVLPFRTSAAGLHRLDGGEGVWAAVSREKRELASGPGPLFVPLDANTTYSLRYWKAETLPRSVRLRAGPEPHAVAQPQQEELRIESPCLRIANPGSWSFRVEADAPLLYSAGLELPARPLPAAAVNTATGEGWLLSAGGGPLGRLRLVPLVLEDGRVAPVLVSNVEQRFRVTVPLRTAALVRADNAGQIIGLSLQPAGAARQGYDWQGAAAGPLATLAGLAEGAYEGHLWDAEQAPERLRNLSLQLYPIAAEQTLPRWSQRSFPVPAGAAVEVRLEQGAQVSLEKGLAAFGWKNGPSGFLSGLEGPVTGALAGARLLLVNTTARPALCALTARAAEAAPEPLSELRSFETAALAAGAEMELASAVPRSARLYLWSAQPVAAARFLSEEDGRIHAGRQLATSLGEIQEFPGGRGRLQLGGTRGALRVWAARPEAWAQGFAARDARPVALALPQEGGRLAAAPQAWSFALEREALACLQADDGGVTALFDRAGALLSVAAGEASRTLLRLLPRGTYTAFTRPWRDAGQAGSLRLRVLEPVALDQEGEGPPALLGPGELALYRFEVKAAGRTGIGVRADGDGLRALLYDGSFRLRAEGVLLLRELEPGPYYLLVSARGVTRRFAPVVYGLAGSLTEVPVEVLRGYQTEGRP